MKHLDRPILIEPSKPGLGAQCDQPRRARLASLRLVNGEHNRPSRDEVAQWTIAQ